MFLLPVILFIPTAYCTTLSPVAPAEKFECIPVDTARRTTVCQKDVWPKDSSAGNIQIYQTTTTLAIQLVTVLAHDFKSIPNLRSLTVLHLESIVTKDAADQEVDFPLKRIMSLLTRNMIVELNLEDVRLRTVSDTDLDGLISLKSLTFKRCEVTTISPDSFYPLATPSKVTAFAYVSFLESLLFEDENELVEFRWDSLYPVAKSLKQVTFSNVKKLAKIKHELSGHLPAMELTILTNIYVYGSKLKTIPLNVVETLTVAQGPLTIEFRRGENKCASCDLMDLIYWMRAQNRCQQTVRLSVTCADENGDHTSLGALIIPDTCPALPTNTTPAPCPTTTSRRTTTSTTTTTTTRRRESTRSSTLRPRPGSSGDDNSAAGSVPSTVLFILMTGLLAINL